MKADRLLLVVQSKVPSGDDLILSALKDTWITSSIHAYNGGDDDEGRVINYLARATDAEMFLAFDVSTFVGFTIGSAILRLAFFSSNAEGNTHWAYKILYNDWVEGELNYHEYKSGSAWATGGHFSTDDFVTSNPAGGSGVVPYILVGEVEFDITAIVQDAIDNGINVNIVIMGVSPETGTVRYDSKEASRAADRPKITIVM